MDGVARLMWWLLSSSRGAKTRVKILSALRDRPRNARQLSAVLALDYSTIRHHLRILHENHLIDSSGNHYGRVYSVSPLLDGRWSEFEAIGHGRQGR